MATKKQTPEPVLDYAALSAAISRGLQAAGRPMLVYMSPEGTLHARAACLTGQRARQLPTDWLLGHFDVDTPEDVLEDSVIVRLREIGRVH